MSLPMKQSREPVVYVVQEVPTRNVVGAMRYGSIETVLSAREEITPLNVPAMTQMIKYKLRNFGPEDYLILMGSPIAIAIAAAFASEQCGGLFSVLKWDGQERRYWPATIDLKQGE